MNKEEQLQEIKNKVFDAAYNMYECELGACSHIRFIESETKKRNEFYNELIWRIQDYEDMLYDDVSEEGLNYNDYSWL